MRIRNEQPADAALIEALVMAAFAQAPHSAQTEHVIVNALRAAGALSVSLVAQEGGAILGHVAASPVSLSDGSTGWHGIGPLAVAPPQQGRGIGSQLMRAALDALRGQGAAGCVLLGEPAYYARFGLAAHRQLLLPGLPAQYFQAIAFNGQVPAATVAYHLAFAATGPQ